MNLFSWIGNTVRSAFSWPSSWPVVNKFFSVGTMTNAGTRVNEEFALGVSAVWSAVTLLADSVSSNRINVVQVEEDTATVLRDHPTARLFRRGPNSDMSTMMLLYVMQAHLGIWSNAYVEIIRNARGRAIALRPLMPTETWPLVDETLPYDVVIEYQNTHNGISRRLQPEDVIHIRGHTTDGVSGYPLIQAMREAIGLAMAQEGFGARFFKNDSRSGGFVSVPNSKVSPKSKKALQDSMSSGGEGDEGEGQGGLDNAWKVKVLEGGARFIPTTITPEQGQFLASRGFQIAEVARFYRVPLVKLDSSASTAWGSGIEQLEIAFVTDTLLPLVRRFEDELTRKLITSREREEGVMIKINIRDRIMGDMQARAELNSTYVSHGILSRNEVRVEEGYNPVDGLDEMLVPLNMAPATETTETDNEDI